MDRTALPRDGFVDPTGGNRHQIEALMSAVGDQILTHLSQAAARSPLPSPPTALAFPTALPETPTDTATLLAHLQTLLQHTMNPAHPGYLGHMDPMASTASLVGDWIAAALNNNMLSVEMSPVFSRLEPLLLQDLAQRFGLGPGAGGLLVSGGSLANLQAIAVARNVKLAVKTKGLAGLSRPPVILASELAHTSLGKAAMVLGLGTDGLIAVATDDRNRLDPVALDQAVQGAIAAGQQPFAVVATAGTTVTGSIDPLPAVADVARRYNLWFHVDAAYGGALIFSSQQRDRLKGIDQADSITFNPQKWLYVTKTCASVLFRQFDHLHREFQIAAPYMNTEADWSNLGELTVQGTRHVDVLKLWLTLQHFGRRGCAALVDASYDLTAQFVKAIHDRPYLTLANPPEMNVICFRGCPDWVPRDRWDDWNQALQRHLLEQGSCVVSLPHYRQARWLKAVLLNPFTESTTLDGLFAALDAFAARGAAWA